MRSVVMAFGLVCLLLLSACTLTDNDDAEENARFAATATANVSRARTVTAEARAEASPTATIAEATNTPARATATPQQAEVSPTATAATDATATPAAPAGGEAEIREQIEEIEQAMVALRGLELQRDVPSAIISRDQLHQNLVELLAEDYSREEAEQDTLEMWLLRLIDNRDLDLYQLFLDLYSERILGYYDSDTEELYVVSDEAGLSALAEMTMAHELTHALQDQHYDIDQLRPEDSHQADRDTAVTALIEGDAEISSTIYLLQHMDPSAIAEITAESAAISSEVIDSAPPYIRESLYFPYVQGSTFVTLLYTDGGFDAIDAAFADLPTSTEQIMHPEKYLGSERDEPQQVELPDLTNALGAGWSQTDHDTLGEFDFQIMLRENGAATYEQAAAGWDGARYALYQNGDNALVVFKTVWDSQVDADEFEAAMRETLGNLTVAEGVWDIGQGRFLGMKAAQGGIFVVTATDRAAVEQAMAAIGG